MLQIVARAFGWQPQRRPAAVSPGDLAAAAPPGLAVTRRGGIGMPPPVLDIAALRAHNQARAGALASGGSPS